MQEVAVPDMLKTGNAFSLIKKKLGHEFLFFFFFFFSMYMWRSLHLFGEAVPAKMPSLG